MPSAGRGYVPFGVALFEAEPTSGGLPFWCRHAPDPRRLLDNNWVRPCPHCGGINFDVAACLVRHVPDAT